jgi:hypothetical protein
MSHWSTARIIETLAALDQASVTDGFEEVSTAHYRLIRYPQRLLSPTLPAAQVIWSSTSLPLDVVFDEVATSIREWGLDAVHWWVTSTTRPPETETYLLARGGVVSDAIQILARELDVDSELGDPSDGIKVELVRDERSLRAAMDVETQGWGRTPSDDQEMVGRLAEVLQDLDSATRFQYVAFIEGRPVATGCCRVEGEVGRLYGAVTLPEFRSRGAYQAILAARLRQIHDVGATIALTRGRPLTSGRILVKSGFRVHGEERCYRLAVN